MGSIIRTELRRPLAAFALATTTAAFVPALAFAVQPAANSGIESAAKSTSQPDNAPAQIDNHIKPMLSAVDQTIKQRQVLFTRVATPQPAWLVLHPGDGHGGVDSSKTLGTVHVARGSHNAVIVHLNTLVIPGQHIYAMLHRDDAEKGKYTYDTSNGREDQPMEVDGHPVTANLEVLRSAKKKPEHAPEDQAKPGQAGPPKSDNDGQGKSQSKGQNNGQDNSQSSNGGKKTPGSDNSSGNGGNHSNGG